MSNEATITVTPKELIAVLAAVKPAVGTRSALTALAGVHIHTTDTESYVEATDIDTACRRVLDAERTGETDVVVSHADLAKVAKAFAKAERISLTVSPAGDGPKAVESVRCNAGARTIELPTLRREDFPDQFAGETTPFLSTDDGAALAKVIERSNMFAGKDYTLPVLTGVCVDFEDGTPTLVATDSYRLSILPTTATLHRAVDHRDPNNNKINIQAAPLAKAAKPMAKASSVKVSLTGIAQHQKRAIIELDDQVWSIRVIDGQYPNYRQLMPDDMGSRISVPVPAFREAAKLAVTFSAKKNPVTRLSANGEVKLSGITFDGPSYEEVLEGATHNTQVPEDFTIGLNPAYLEDILKCYVSDTAVVRVISPLRPALFEDGDDRYLVMPIRLP